MVNQIDSIFQNVKKQVIKGGACRSQSTFVKNNSKVSKSSGLVSSTPSKSKMTRAKGTASDPFSLQQKAKDLSNEVTEEGWKIYTPEELNIGKGGDTELCPFDCECCF